MAVGRYVGPFATLAGKAWPSGDNTSAQWPWRRPKPFVSRHYPAETYRRRFGRAFKVRVILVGHSYAGMIISGVVEINPTQVRRLVFLDAFIPDDEESVLDLLPSEIGTYFRSVARDHGDGWRLPGGEGQLDLWGLKPGEARDFVRARLCDFSLRCFEEPLRLPANRKASIPSTFVSSVAEEYPARPFFAPFSAKARALGWKVVELNTGHDCHVERPGEVANILLNE
jgi:pimeloyl-ACP methyl ester carboxylesterase